MPSSLLRLATRRPIAVAGICALVSLIDGLQMYVGLSLEGAPGLSPWRWLLVGMGMWMPWAAFFPLVLWLADHVPGRPLLRAAGVHLAAALAAAATHALVISAVIHLVEPVPGARPRTLASRYITELSFGLTQQLLIYFAILGALYALELQRRYRDRELRAAQLERELSQAQLEALRLQLQPHFLFNSLHAIAAHVRTQRGTAAVRMISALADLLRYTLDGSGRQKVHLAEEIEVLDRYLDLQRARFSDRLKIDIVVAPDVRDALVPSLLLQPLVENAVRHGIAAVPGEGAIRITCERRHGTLRLEVHDSGPGVDASGPVDGIGLGNVRARLARIYQGSASLELSRHPAGGTAAVVTLPLETAAQETAA